MFSQLYYVVIFQVKKIFIPKQYKGDVQNYVGDIGIIISKKIFKLSFTVQPVCVDWGLKYQDTLINPSASLVGYVSVLKVKLF